MRARSNEFIKSGRCPEKFRSKVFHLVRLLNESKVVQDASIYEISQVGNLLDEDECAHGSCC